MVVGLLLIYLKNQFDKKAHFLWAFFKFYGIIYTEGVDVLKKIFITLLLFILVGCASKITTEDAKSNNDTTLEVTTNDSTTEDATTTQTTEITSEPSITEVTTNVETTAVTTTEVTTEKPNTTTEVTTDKPNTTDEETTKVSYNPDGSVHLAPPTVSVDITEWQEFSFESSMPDGFLYISGNKAFTPSSSYFYSAGGIKMDENQKGKKGFQTCLFNSFKKIELRINIGKFYGTQKSAVQDVPVFTIYGFDTNGNLVATEVIDELSTNKANSYVKVYLRGEDIAYIEVRATNLPCESGKVYNFGITGISIKGWPYD